MTVHGWGWGDIATGTLVLGAIIVAALGLGNTLALVLLILGVLAYVPLNRLQDRAETRACPRCGGRVPVGELDCPHCDFDFRTIG